MEEGEAPPPPPDDCRSLLFILFLLAHVAISVGPDNHGAAFGGQKSPFTLGQPRAAKKKKKKNLNSITEIASANTYRHTNPNSSAHT